MAFIIYNAAEGSRSGLRKTYITSRTQKDVVKRQKKATGSKCDHRRTCGTSYGHVPGKKQIKRKS